MICFDRVSYETIKLIIYFYEIIYGVIVNELKILNISHQYCRPVLYTALTFTMMTNVVKFDFNILIICVFDSLTVYFDQLITGDYRSHQYCKHCIPF